MEVGARSEEEEAVEAVVEAIQVEAASSSHMGLQLLFLVSAK